MMIVRAFEVSTPIRIINVTALLISRAINESATSSTSISSVTTPADLATSGFAWIGLNCLSTIFRMCPLYFEGDSSNLNSYAEKFAKAMLALT